jgi:hypothetical protein
VIEPLANLPANVIGFEAIGEVEASDYRDVLVPAIDAAAEQGEVRLVYVLGDRFKSYSMGAGWLDAKLGLRHFGAWKRAALVSDHDWVQHLVTVFGWMVPGEVKRFSLAEQDEAIAWAAGDS